MQPTTSVKLPHTHNQLFCAYSGLPKYTRIVGFKYCGSQIEHKHQIKSNKTNKTEMQKR